MAAAAPIAIGLMVASTMVTAYGTAKGQMHEAAQARDAATAGRIAADQNDTMLNEELTSTLANIDAIRASGGASSGSLTTNAVKGEQVRQQNRTRRITRGNALRQANQDDRDSKYLRGAARTSLLAGALKSAAIAAQGVSDLKSSAPKGDNASVQNYRRWA